MRTAYLGRPEGALALAAAGHEIVAAGISGLGTGSASLVAALGTRPDSIRFLPRLARGEEGTLLGSSGARLLVCFLWPRLVPPAVLGGFREGALSYHPSLLPRHRGPDPYFWTVYCGDREAGVSILWLDAGVDTGPIVAQRRIAVSAEWTAGDLADRLDALGLDLLVATVDRLEVAGRLPCSPQDEAGATAAPQPDDDLVAIRWSQRAADIERLVRAASPHPGAATIVGEQLVVVRRARVHDLPSPGALEPGDAVLIDAGVLVWTGEGGLLLDEIAVPGATFQGLEVARAFPGLSDLRRDRRAR